MWFIPKYILILAITILIDYYAGILIEKAEGAEKKKYLVISIISTCAVLFVFKYYNFFTSNFIELANFFGLRYPIETLNIILPIGLSFHTFQSLSYVIEVYRGRQKAEYNFGIYSLYVMFYPQLVAGPIERPQHLLHQFYEEHYFDYLRVTDGLKLMAWGLFKKVVIADRLSVMVGQVYGDPSAQPGIILILGTVFFAFQIYCDFSGYSDIAVGAAQVMGFKLMTNFNRPYFSKSIAEFWKRWHISLTTWFRDYIFTPLSWRVGIATWRWQLSLLFTFFVSGLWHGANWTYVIWGTINGFYMIFSLWTKSTRDRLYNMFGFKNFKLLVKLYQITVTFSLTCFAWIFFRAKNLHDAMYIVKHLFDGVPDLLRKIFVLHTVSGLGYFSALPNEKGYYVTSFLLIVFLIVTHMFQRRRGLRIMLREQPVLVRWAAYYALVGGILVLGMFNSTSFIYFQF